MLNREEDKQGADAAFRTKNQPSAPGRELSDFLRDLAIIVLGFLGVIGLLRLVIEYVRGVPS